MKRFIIKESDVVIVKTNFQMQCKLIFAAAKNKVDVPTSLTEISLRQGISLSFLEQLFNRLKKYDLVQSTCLHMQP